MKLVLRKALAVLPLAAACAAFGSAAQAQQVITIGGEVKDISCTATIPGGNALTLPHAEPAELPNAGSIAHQTVFTIALTACAAGSDNTVARAMFYNTTAGAVTNGRLNPTFTPANAGGWQYMFRAGTTGTVAVPVRTGTGIVVQANDPGATITNNAANLRYRVMYYRTNSATLEPGKGAASVNYVLYYL